MADNFRPTSKQQDKMSARFNEWSEAASQLGPLNDFEIFTPRETTPTYQTISAPTTNPARPRALKLAYSREAQKLVVKFRGNKGNEGNGPWIAYDDVPVDMWNDLKASNSTGLYLKYSGLDSYPWTNFNPSEMTAETRVLFNEL